MALQALLGSLTLYLAFRCLAFLPLGDALTIVSTAPLFTVLLSLAFFRIRIGLWKALLCTGFLAGLVLNIQPPFIFPQNENALGNSTRRSDDSETHLTVQSGPKYIGVILAICCTIAGSLNNIVIKRYQALSRDSNVSSLALVFYLGFGGVITVFLVSFADMGVDHLISEIQKTDARHWSILVSVSSVGVLAYSAFAASLKFVSATTCSVIGAIEIVLAYIFQIAFLGVWPNTVGITGALLVMASVVGIALEERYLSNGSSDNNVGTEEQGC